MRDLPILFKPDMHRAIRERRKTETRRIVKMPKWAEPGTVEEDNDCKGGLMAIYDKTGCFSTIKPRYQVGDRLWVKEAWRARAAFDNLTPAEIGQRVGKEVRYELDGTMSFEQKLPFSAGKLRSSLFMPYWAARTWLEVTGVRAERLQEITEEGAKAEGVHVGQRARLSGVPPHVTPCLICGQPYRSHVGQAACCFGRCGDVYCDCSYRGGYAWLWDQINGKGSWDANPWVWVYQFKLWEAR